MSTVREGSFQRALDKFKAGLSAEQLRSFSICTQDEVLQVVDDIQREHGPKRTLKNMQRIGGFLEAMDHLGKSIEVFLNVHELVCFIWVSLQLVLMHPIQTDRLADIIDPFHLGTGTHQVHAGCTLEF